ncbi:Rho GTPase-activating protein 20 [Amphibalanus amphitrite]|uniref:Rho GTPase-activating protein 20 n=1 Tax=Amphibalanus amphitrite TaxID=1232801 RepID=A0A6A4X195_AMPAM|nr:Rho GTPase-activating protein 20 [Amphibalanus amphitrite]
MDSLCAGCQRGPDGVHRRCRYAIARVKFGLPLDQVCKNDIPGPLLVLILKLNKEAPFRKDVFRAPGHQANMKKLVHFLQNGRLVNLDNFSIYTIASVLKKFLRKIPDGIFGPENEQQLFQTIELDDPEQQRDDIHRYGEQRDDIHRLITSLPVYTQHLLVLLFGTFRVIATNAERARTGMTSEALGVSVAPSFFQSCVAMRIMKFLIDNFGVSNLFGRDNYEYYARITGRILKVEEDWIFSFRYPPDNVISRVRTLDAQRQWIVQEMDHFGVRLNLEAMSIQEESMSIQEECQSTPALLHLPEGSAAAAAAAGAGGTDPAGGPVPENTLRQSYTRLSVSLEENGLFKVASGPSSSASSCTLKMTLDELRDINKYAESTKSLSFLPLVRVPRLPLGFGGGGASSVDRDKRLVRRSSSKDKERRLVRRSSSKKDKENGAQLRQALAAAGGGGGVRAGRRRRVAPPAALRARVQRDQHASLPPAAARSR